MALMTMVARVVDGLPLVGTMQDDEQVGTSSIYYLFNKRIILKSFLFIYYSLAKVSWNIKIKLKCYSEN